MRAWSKHWSLPVLAATGRQHTRSPSLYSRRWTLRCRLTCAGFGEIERLLPAGSLGCKHLQWGLCTYDVHQRTHILSSSFATRQAQMHCCWGSPLTAILGMQGGSSLTTIQHGFNVPDGDHAWHTRKGSGLQTAAAAGSSVPGFKGLLEISNGDMLPSASASPVSFWKDHAAA